MKKEELKYLIKEELLKFLNEEEIEWQDESIPDIPFSEWEQSNERTDEGGRWLVAKIYDPNFEEYRYFITAGIIFGGEIVDIEGDVEEIDEKEYEDYL
jgi:hypothetical protein